MKTKDALYWILIAIAVITALSGLGQMLMPGFVLEIVGGEPSASANHFFGIVGMFMLLFGSLLLHALLHPDRHSAAVFWTGMQKFGAFAAVSLGVMNAIFGPLALLVAGFDLISGILIIWYWNNYAS